jgi:hypothetical protein
MTLPSSLLSFDPTQKLHIHIAQTTLTTLAIILSISRVAIRNRPATRANTAAITMVRPYLRYRNIPDLIAKPLTGHQIPPRHRLPNPNLAPQALPQMGEHESQRGS